MKVLGQVEEKLESNFSRDLRDLEDLVKIPSVSFDGYNLKTVTESAEAVAGLLEKRGLKNVAVIPHENAHPYVCAEWVQSPQAPTVLLYAHHDVQPSGRENLWKSDPFVPTRREGPGGMRLWGRGTADDKAGVLVHVAAISAFLETVGELPVNVKLLIEGEEEVGSSHLSSFLKAHRERLLSDALILTDTANYDCGIPSLTIALRGLVVLNVEVRALSKTVHSGMWGGPIPDPAMALCQVLSGLVDAQGRPTVKEIRDQVIPLTEDEIREYQALPYSDESFRAQSGLLPGAQLLREASNPFLQIWRLPSLTIHGIQANTKGQAGNVINDSAWARVGVRVAPGMDPSLVAAGLEREIRARLAWGLTLEVTHEAAASGWKADVNGPNRNAYQAALRALEAGYRKKPVFMGCGGTIPFVEPLATAFGKEVPVLMLGVEDPYTNAHGENESMLISDFKMACKSQVHLLSELARVL